MSREYNYTPLALLASCLLLVGLIATYRMVAAAAAVEGPLFSDATTSIPAYDNQQNALRSRAVTVNFAKLAHLANTQNEAVEIKLFDDVSFTAQPQRTMRFNNGGYVWIGKDPQNPMSDISLSVYGDALSGTFNLYDHLYNIRYAGNGVHVIQQLPLNYRIDAEPLQPTLSIDTAAIVPASDSQTPHDNSSFVDVLVVYTPSARNAVGGTNAMQALINLAIAETNTGYDNSGVNFDMHLVGTQELPYNETSGAPDYNEFSNALTQITSKNDGVIDNIHALRDAYGADAVSFIINGSSFCGIAWLMSTETPAFEGSAFSVTDYSCATGYYSFGHEIGHNMGSSHDRLNGGQGIFPYSYGYQDPNGDFRTIMGYFNGCNGSCPRINYWSNPNVNYNGLGLTGVDPNASNSAANYMSLNNTIDTVANFRTSLSSVTPTPTATATHTPTATPTNTPTVTPTSSPTPLPTVQVTIEPNGGSINSGYLSVIIPPGTVNESIVLHFEALKIEDLPAPPTDDSLGTTNYEFDLFATYESSGLPADPEDGTTYAITILYNDDPFGPLNQVKENTLGLYYWDEINQEWVLEATSLVDVDLNILQANPDKFGTWAVFGEGPKRIFLPFTIK